MGIGQKATRLVRRARDWAGSAIRDARETAPHIKQGADALKKSYKAVADSGMIDQYGGKYSAQIHGAAKKATDGYDSLERAARQGDGALRSAGL
jgi:hypothetical protein